MEITNRILKQYPQHELATEAREEIENRKRDQKMDSEILTLTSPYKKTVKFYLTKIDYRYYSFFLPILFK